ncbi:nucleotidyltransferase family protein [Myxococcota bacterium]|nr:nucleotidyltransferase family protein [Myxococcota bacterium]MBU1535760.1 nucleotidyltransferase family protein [Myxococcota bacterium]
MSQRTPVTSSTQILERISSLKEVLHSHYTVERIGLFGSFARGEGRVESDVDLLVEFASETFDHYMDCKFLLEETLGRPVDLVLPTTLKPRLRDQIMHEVVYA